MELMMYGLIAVLMANALAALGGVCASGLIGGRERIYNGQHDAARRR
jgi:hypothetical protein